MSLRRLVWALPLFFGCRTQPKSAFDWHVVVPYQRGDVLHHAPERCPGGRIYADLPAVLSNEGTEAAAEVVGAKFYQSMTGGKGGKQTKRALKALHRALKEEGVDPLHDTQELALCFPSSQESMAAVVGGKFSGHDVLGAIQSASSSEGEDLPIHHKDGIPYLELDSILIARLTPNVVLLTEDPSMLADLSKDVDRTKVWGWQPGRIAVASFDDHKDDLDMRIAVADREGQVEIDATLASKSFKDPSLGTDEGKKKLRDGANGIATRMEKTPFKALAEPVRNVGIVVSPGFLRLTLLAPAGVMRDAVKSAAKLSSHDLGQVIEYCWHGGEEHSF